jgi:hypothetical protein
MTDVLEHERNLRQSYFRTQKIIMVIRQLGVSEMIPTMIHFEPKDTSDRENSAYVLASP